MALFGEKPKKLVYPSEYYWSQKKGLKAKNILPGTVALGGSIKETKPRSLNPERGKLMGFVLNWNPGGKPFLAGSLKKYEE